MKNRTHLIIAGTVFLLGTTLSVAAPATENWENNCTKCHGEDGKGQTKMGKKLKLKDYSDAKVQAEMKDEAVIKAITDGITDDAGKERMKGYKADLTAEEIKDLLALVRKFKA